MLRTLLTEGGRQNRASNLAIFEMAALSQSSWATRDGAATLKRVLAGFSSSMAQSSTLEAELSSKRGIRARPKVYAAKVDEARPTAPRLPGAEDLPVVDGAHTRGGAHLDAGFASTLVEPTRSRQRACGRAALGRVAARATPLLWQLDVVLNVAEGARARCLRMR